MHQFEFGDETWRAAAEQVEMPTDLKDWVMLQISRGQDYYAKRIARLGLSGGKVLDAGCGMGNWSLGLARWFEEVYAIEIDKKRLEVLAKVAGSFNGRIVPVFGSIEALPFASGTFEAIFCNGVVFLTDYRKSLSEFGRVLRRGGWLYLTYNTRRWWDHIINDRGPTEPICLTYGCNAYIALLFRYLDEIDLVRVLRRPCRNAIAGGLVRHFLGWNLPVAIVPASVLRLAFDRLVREPVHSARYDEFEAHAMALTQAELQYHASTEQEPSRKRKMRAALEVLAFIREKAAPEYGQRALIDVVARACLGESHYQSPVQTHSFEPEEMIDLLLNVGFAGFSTSPEGTLVNDARAPVAEPIYTRKQGVFELLATRER